MHIELKKMKFGMLSLDARKCPRGIALVMRGRKANKTLAVITSFQGRADARVRAKKMAG